MRINKMLLAEILHAANRITTARNGMLSGVGMTSARVRLMKTIRRLPVPFTIAQLARVMDVSRQAVRPVVRELEAAELVSMGSQLPSRRSPVVVLTSLGRERLDEVLRLEERWVADVTRGFSNHLLAQTEWVVRCLRKRTSD